MNKERTICCLLFASLIPLEIVSAFLAYETLGEITSGAYLLGVGLNLPLLIFSWKKPLAGAIGGVVLAAAIIPYQVLLTKRLMDVQTEAVEIVTFVYRNKASTGSFPADLKDYTFSNPDLKQFIQSYRRFNSDKFQLTYRVGTESTSHWYSSDSGWHYYPD